MALHGWFGGSKSLENWEAVGHAYVGSLQYLGPCFYQIDRVLTEEITPTLEKLRMEKGNYLT